MTRRDATGTSSRCAPSGRRECAGTCANGRCTATWPSRSSGCATRRSCSCRPITDTTSRPSRVCSSNTTCVSVALLSIGMFSIHTVSGIAITESDGTYVKLYVINDRHVITGLDKSITDCLGCSEQEIRKLEYNFATMQKISPFKIYFKFKRLYV